MGILLVFPTGLLFLSEIEVWPYILLAIVILLLVVGLVFVIDSYTPILPRGSKK
jgi:hypothetical protein